MKSEEIKKMTKEEKKKKLEELELELIKSHVGGSKKSISKTKEIKKLIAKILTLNK